MRNIWRVGESNGLVSPIAKIPFPSDYIPGRCCREISKINRTTARRYIKGKISNWKRINSNLMRYRTGYARSIDYRQSYHKSSILCIDVDGIRQVGNVSIPKSPVPCCNGRNTDTIGSKLDRIRHAIARPCKVNLSRKGFCWWQDNCKDYCKPIS